MAYKDPERAKEYSKAYRELHKSRLKAQRDAYVEEHKEDLKSWGKLYYRANKDVLRAKNKIYEQTHRDKKNSASRASYLKNKASIKERRAARKILKAGRRQTFIEWRASSWCARKYNKRGIPVLLSKDEFYRWCEDMRWLIEPLLDLKLHIWAMGPSVDRIDSSGPYSIDNIRILTHSENSSKR